MIVPAELKTLLQSESDSDGRQLIQILESASDDATLEKVVLLLIKILGRLRNNAHDLSLKKAVQRSQSCDLGSATSTVDQIAFIYPRCGHSLFLMLYKDSPRSYSTFDSCCRLCVSGESIRWAS